MPVLLLLVGVRNIIFDIDTRRWLADAGRPGMCNNDNSEAMVTTKIGRHTVEMYDAIDELPIVRFQKYQKMLLVDAGVGGDIAAFDQRTERARRFLLAGKPDKAQKEFDNLRQCVFLVQSGINPRHRAFAVLVSKIDGEPCDDLSDGAIDKIVERLGDAPVGEVDGQLRAVKKKIDAELQLYFPKLFGQSEVKEYFDLLRRRTLEILERIERGEADPAGGKEVDALTTALITFSNPDSFEGSEGLEVRQDRQFENLCLALSEQLHVRPKEYTVLEFYNAFDFLRERSKEAEKAQKRAK